MNNGFVAESTGRFPHASAKSNYYEQHNLSHNQHNIPWHKTSSVVCGVVRFSISGTCSVVAHNQESCHDLSACWIIGFSGSPASDPACCSVGFSCLSHIFAAGFPAFIAVHPPDFSVVGHFPFSSMCSCCCNARPCCRTGIRCLLDQVSIYQASVSQVGGSSPVARCPGSHGGAENQVCGGGGPEGDVGSCVEWPVIAGWGAEFAKDGKSFRFRLNVPFQHEHTQQG